MGEIYLITNTANGKRYVGQTKFNTEHRFNEHLFEATLNRSNSVLYKAINKYGADKFSVKCLLKNIPEDKLNHYESLWIRKLNTYIYSGNGYNLTNGGVGVRGYRHSDSTKLKMSQSLKGVPLNHGDKIKAGFIRNNSYERRSKNPNWRANISKARKGKFKGAENGFFGKHHTEEFKINHSKKVSKPILMYSLEGKLLKRFDNGYNARNWLLENNYTTNKSCESAISKACRQAQRKTAYGFIWKFEFESVETNRTTGDEFPLEVQGTL